jgi:lipoprotein-anchoring transpeptidase ErfK/SrfK
MPRWVGLLGSWALLVLGVGLLAYAVAAEAITMSDAHKLQRVEMINGVISDNVDNQVKTLQQQMSQRSVQVGKLQSEVATSDKQISDPHDPDFIITVSTAENKVYAKRNGQLVFEAVCSTGKNTALNIGGRTMVFRTPIGRFKIQSKEEHPLWVPPDWHYVEQARKQGLDVVRLNRGDCVADVCAQGSQVYAGGAPVDPGALVVRGGAVIIPPVGTSAREVPDVLGNYRLNIGDGYALHGTQEVSRLGTNASHGCVRLDNKDIERLYQMANVGDEVVIY